MSDIPDRIAILERQLQRERAARKQAERLLEEKASELYQVNTKLQELNIQLEEKYETTSVALEEQQRRYGHLVNGARDIIYISSPDGICHYINPAVEEILGYQQQDFVGQPFIGFVHPDYRKEVTSFYDKQIRSFLRTTYHEFPCLHKSGEVVWIGQIVNLVIKTGVIVEWMAIARDITESRRASKEIERLNARLSAILGSLQEGILVENEKREIALVNEQFCRFFQIPAAPDQLRGMDCSDSAEQAKHLFQDPEGFVRGIEIILKNQAIVVGDLLEMADGRILERDYIPILLEGKYAGHLWKYSDITARMMADRRIRQSEEKYRGIIENMELGLMEVDANGVITKPYPRFCQMTGYEPKDLIGKVANDVFLEEEQKERMYAEDSKRLRGQPGVYEVRVKNKKGEIMWLLISGAPFYDEGGKMAGSIGIHYDITYQKELQSELEEARTEAERARDAEKEFLANMSHEIRNPINSIVGMTNLLYDTELDERQRKYVDNLKFSSDILMALVSDILDISKITEGKMEISEREFRLEELLKGLENIALFRLEGKPVSFQTRRDNRIPSVLLGDNTFLNQILLNLIGNAIKFTHKGEISLEVSLIREDEREAQLRFILSDTGIGIDPGRIDRIFDRFSQAGKATRHQYGGSGLGLPITKNLIELMGGTISVKSKPGEGTSFFLELPFQKSQAFEKMVREQGIEDKADDPDLEDLHVLIVEDNEVNRMYLKTIVSNMGFTSHSCENGQQALETLDDAGFDLILMDIRMPVMDGYETTIRLRSKTGNPNSQIPIIALTASALLDEKQKALDVGMDYHLTKPFTPDQLRKAIDSLEIRTAIREERDAPDSLPAPFNNSEVKALYGGDYQHLYRMLKIYANRTPHELQQLQELLVTQDRGKVGDVLHKIKPGFSMVGLGYLTRRTQELEDRLEAGETIRQLRKDFDEYITEINKTLQKVSKLDISKD